MSDTIFPTSRGRHAREISDEIVRLTREGTGRGPVRARVIIDGDAVVVLMHETLTKAERTLVDAGRAEEVLALRRAVQDVLRPAYVEAVQRITVGTVATFMSTNSTEPDHAAEVFLLAPENA